MTTNFEFYGRPDRETASEIIQKSLLNENRISGTKEIPADQQGLKMTSVLTGEKYRNRKKLIIYFRQTLNCLLVIDPKDNTSVQRSWLPFKDKALLYAEENLQKNQEINTKSGFKTNDPLKSYKINMKQTLAYDIATSLAIGGRKTNYEKKTQFIIIN